MERIRDSKNKRLIDQTDITGEVGVYYALRHLDKMPYDVKAVVMGYGRVASGAIKSCHKLGMKTKILRKSEYKYIQQYLKDTDLLINGISWPASHRNNQKYLVTREHIKQSNPKMIVLDLAVDFPNPIETIRPTNYSQPYYIDENRIHISIYGYPGLVPVTSTNRYSEQVLPLVQIIANNSGLRGIKNRGNLGKAISKAILNPKRYDWQKYKPKEPEGSMIE
jgi:N5-(carboxyethyl)ornithine synthase